MKTNKICLDFSNHQQILEMLRLYSISNHQSQKSTIIQALESYFSEKLESRLILKAAEQTFAEWDNKDDDTYNNL